MQIPKYLPELTVFVSGAVIMIYELVGTRVLGPYFGTSLYIWTNLIAIFLGSLTLGYYIGGKLADLWPRLSLLSYLIFMAGALIALTLAIKEPLLSAIAHLIPSSGLGSAVAAIVLFLPSSLVLGMVSPLAGKLKINSLSSSGSSLGELYAISTAGSIIGTYLAGYWLIPWLGTNYLLLALALTLILLSLYISPHLRSVKAITLLSLILSWPLFSPARTAQLFDVDTAYNRVWVYENTLGDDQRPVRVMGINAENHSRMFVDSLDLANEYTKYFHLARHFVPHFDSALMLGGAGYSFPKDYLRVYPSASLDVVEIDSGVTELAKHFFDLQDNPRLAIIHDDARLYLNNSDKKYDVILGDVFSSRNSLPFHLTTVESVQSMYDRLGVGGAVIVNLITAIEGERGQFFRAQYRTFASVFPHVYAFTVSSREGGEVQNIILVASKSPTPIALTSEDKEISQYLNNYWATPIDSDLPILTDDHAPVEHYIKKLM